MAKFKVKKSVAWFWNGGLETPSRSQRQEILRRLLEELWTSQRVKSMNNNKNSEGEQSWSIWKDFHSNHDMLCAGVELHQPCTKEEISVKCSETLPDSLMHETSCLGWGELVLSVMVRWGYIWCYTQLWKPSILVKRQYPFDSHYVQHTVKHLGSLMVWDDRTLLGKV